MEVFVLAAAEQAAPGGFMAQSRLQQAEEHQRLLLIQAEQVIAWMT